METSNYNEVAATSNQAEMVFTPTKNPFEPQFNSHQTLMQDSEGFLYRIVEDLSHWQPKAASCNQVLLETLRKNGEKQALQPFWDIDDFDGMFKKYQEIKSSQLGLDDIPELVDKIYDELLELGEGRHSEFRLRKHPKAEEIIIKLLAEGKTASEVSKLFIKKITDEKGKVNDEPVVKMPTIISRRNKIIINRYKEGETDLGKLARFFSLTEKKIETIISK